MYKTTKSYETKRRPFLAQPNAFCDESFLTEGIRGRACKCVLLK
ncbi:hypothetical protein CIPAW_11G086300 [Carya illinoinensis]|uniref:Uncharacterized protein n=1 Tax=Carya illinoinensis TaxID=32201 RepID=A0A8T1P058_CARIL|nr:hypothetical protein CIPAW_11G086300 [Carya illinoinensis]